MRLPIVPLVVAATILAAVVYFFNASSSGDHRTLDAPRLTRLSDVEGVETEVALSPDGTRCAVISDGDLFLVNLSDNASIRLTQTAGKETFPSWSPDGRRLNFGRGQDTFVVQIGESKATPEMFKSGATFLSWSPTGRQTFVKDGGLWLTDVGGANERQIVAPDENPNVTIRSPRFSPDSREIAFIKSLLGITGQVWTVDALSGAARALVADRPMENPLDVAWILDGRDLAYLTNRSGGYSIWHINFASNTLLPLTPPLMDKPLAPIGMSAWKDRIVLPRHFEDSNIALSDGTIVAHSENIESEPAASPDGKSVAYTVVKGNKSEIWTAGSDGSNPMSRALGHEPRFAADGLHVVYSNTDLSGNADVWRLDIRNGETERITDADEIDITPDASRDGRWLAFASTRSIAPSIWIIPASGGKRLRINDGGYGPRFSPDSRSILFWNKEAMWTMAVDGSHLLQASTVSVPSPLIGNWFKSVLAYIVDDEVRSATGSVLFKSNRPMWPLFDVMPDGRLLLAPIDIRETAIWAVDLQFKTQ